MAKRKGRNQIPTELLKRGKGQPRKVLDETMVYKLAQSMLSVKSIAVILECSEDTINDNYAVTLQRGRENRRQSLVEAMWQKGLEDKDTKMLIWLSKQHLGYREMQPDEATQINFNVMVNELPGQSPPTTLEHTAPLKKELE